MGRGGEVKIHLNLVEKPQGLHVLRSMIILTGARSRVVVNLDFMIKAWHDMTRDYKYPG